VLQPVAPAVLHLLNADKGLIFVPFSFSPGPGFQADRDVRPTGFPEQPTRDAIAHVLSPSSGLGPCDSTVPSTNRTAKAVFAGPVTSREACAYVNQ